MGGGASADESYSSNQALKQSGLRGGIRLWLEQQEIPEISCSCPTLVAQPLYAKDYSDEINLFAR